MPERDGGTAGDRADAPMLARDFDTHGLTPLRRQVARLAQDNGLSDPGLYRFVLAVHEIATNAVRHGGGKGHLELRRTGNELRCRITDHGRGMLTGDRPTLAATQALTGRGLWLARRACDITTVTAPTGTTVTLIYQIDPSTAPAR